MSFNQIRSGQLITTFGPGAMVDLPDCSIIVGGLDGWRYPADNIPVIDEPRLVGKLKRLLEVENLTLRRPPASNDDPQSGGPCITVWSFPEWFIVQHREPVVTKGGFKARRLVHFQQLDKGKFRDHDRKTHPVVPVRFVRACRKGHVGDIDWKAFVHGAGSTCMRDMWMEERGTSGDLSEVWVRCECGEDRSMNQAAMLALKALGNCNGSRPWLGPNQNERCGEPSRLLIRSASNAYFPQLMSVISLGSENDGDDLQKAVKGLWDDFLVDVEEIADLEKMRRKPTVRNALESYTDAEVMEAIQREQVGSSIEDVPVKQFEFDVLSQAKEEIGSDRPDGDSDFYARTLPKHRWDAPWMKPFERVVLVHRLREVIAQVGFTRFEAAGPDIQGELAIEVQRAPLAQETSWLPALENRGEGLFIQVSRKAITDWLVRPEVVERGRALATGFNLWKEAHPTSKREFPGLAYYMLHTFSHLLLTSISLECGYPASSLRERVYAGDGRFGILLYTGSPDAEGTLGGLIETGRGIKHHIYRAIELGSLCSNDPVCASHLPVQHDPLLLHGAACHGCALIAETSCEQSNNFLDRALVVPTVEGLGAEFFRGVL